MKYKIILSENRGFIIANNYFISPKGNYTLVIGECTCYKNTCNCVKNITLFKSMVSKIEESD